MINQDNLKKMLDQKYISVQKHPEADLFIYNYTQKAQFDRIWNDETLQCRGLILNAQGQIVQRPFRKFFNLEEHEDLPIEPFEVYEKLDGSLGILYWINDEPFLATRGSFISDQAVKGTQLLRKYPAEWFNPRLTYLFEIIYPENRIVVDYKGMEDLVLLGIIDPHSGAEIDYDWMTNNYKNKLKIAQKYANIAENIKDIRAMHGTEEENKEGFVIRLESGMRIKVKFEDYVRLHRLVTGVNARRIWDLLRNDQPLDELLERVPDEFYAWVKNTRNGLVGDFEQVEHFATKAYNKVKDLPTRREQAIEIMKEDRKYSSIVFKMLDGKSYDDIIWKMLRPKHETPFKTEI